MGKAFAKKTQGRRIKGDEKLIEDLFAFRNGKSTPPTISIPPRGTSVPGLNNYLKKTGDTMTGPIAYRPLPVTVDANGHIDIKLDETGNGTKMDTSYVLATGTGSPDDLHFIDGAQFNGQYLIMQGTASQILNIRRASLPSISNIVGDGATNIITVTTAVPHELATSDMANILQTVNFDKQGATVTVTSPTIFTYDLGAVGSASAESIGMVQDGNIVTPDGTDIEMDGTVAVNERGLPIVEMVFDVTVSGFGAWRVLSAAGTTGGGTGGGIQDPIILGSHDEVNYGSAKSIDWSLNNHHYGVLDDNCTITMINLSAVDKYEPVILQFKQDATGGRVVTWANSFVNGGVPFIDPQANAYTTVVFYTDGNQDIHAFSTMSTDSLAMDMSDENTSLNIASASIPFRTFWTDFAFYITKVVITVTTAPAGGGAPLTVDVKKNGTTIFTTKVSIDDGENTSETALTPYNVTTPQLGFNDKMELFLTIRDAGNVATGLKCKLIGVKN